MPQVPLAEVPVAEVGSAALGVVLLSISSLRGHGSTAVAAAPDIA